MARTLVSIVLAWDVHYHDSTFPCAKATLTVTYTDTVNLTKTGSNTHVLTQSRSLQMNSAIPLHDTVYESAALADIQQFVASHIPTTLANAVALTTVTKSVEYP